MKPGLYLEIVDARIERLGWRRWQIVAAAQYPHSAKLHWQPIFAAKSKREAQKRASALIGELWYAGDSPLYADPHAII